MNSSQQYEQRVAAYRRMKPTIDHTYPRGSFVAIDDDKVIASGPSLRSVRELIRATGRDPRQVLVVEAGVDYPEYVTIFM